MSPPMGSPSRVSASGILNSGLLTSHSSDGEDDDDATHSVVGIVSVCVVGNSTWCTCGGASISTGSGMGSRDVCTFSVADMEMETGTGLGSGVWSCCIDALDCICFLVGG